MYRLAIYEDDDLICLVHGTLEDFTFILENLHMKINYRFKITSL